MTEKRRFINKFEHFVERKFILSVQMGKVPGASIRSFLSENPNIQSGTPATLWNFPDEPIYTFSSTAAIDSISSDNVGDTVPIFISGLDTDFNVSIQIPNLNGQNRVALSPPLIRINDAFNATETKTDLLGNVYIYENTAISNGKPDDTLKVKSYISVDEQQSLIGVLTILAGHTGFFLGSFVSISKQPAAGNAIFTAKIRTFNGVFRTAQRFNLSSTGSSEKTIDPTAMSPIPQKTDLIGSALVTANGTGVSLTFDFLLLDNEIFKLS